MVNYQVIPGLQCVWFLGLGPFFAYVVPAHKMDEGIRVAETLSRYVQNVIEPNLDEILPWAGNV